MELLAVFIGGSLGALLRYFIYSQFDTFYIPTFLIRGFITTEKADR